MTGEIQAFFVTTRAANFNAYQSASVFPLVLPQTSNRRAPSLLGVWHAKSMRIPNLVRYRDFFFTETTPTRASLWCVGGWWLFRLTKRWTKSDDWGPPTHTIIGGGGGGEFPFLRCQPTWPSTGPGAMFCAHEVAIISNINATWTRPTWGKGGDAWVCKK